MAAFLCGGQKWNIGRSVHSSDMCWGWTRSIDGIRALVHFHIKGPTSHLVILCGNVSVSPQREQAVVGVRWITANRSLVGMMSCIAAYHVDTTRPVGLLHACLPTLAAMGFRDIFG
jgi:hypothetical protein